MSDASDFQSWSVLCIYDVLVLVHKKRDFKHLNSATWSFDTFSNTYLCILKTESFRGLKTWTRPGESTRSKLASRIDPVQPGIWGINLMKRRVRVAILAAVLGVWLFRGIWMSKYIVPAFWMRWMKWCPGCISIPLDLSLGIRRHQMHKQSDFFFGKSRLKSSENVARLRWS